MPRAQLSEVDYPGREEKRTYRAAFGVKHNGGARSGEPLPPERIWKFANQIQAREIAAEAIPVHDRDLVQTELLRRRLAATKERTTCED